MPKYVVRHGVMRNLGIFSTRGSDTFARGHQVIARTHRGLESGEVLCEATQEAVHSLKDPKQGQILRRLTDDDVRDLRKMFEQERREYTICQERIQELNLQMQLADVDFVTRAPGGKEVEELSKKEIFKALRERVTSEQYKEQMSGPTEA